MNDKQIAALKEDLEFAKGMVQSWEEYLVWDEANPWDRKSLRQVPFHHIPDNYKRKMERPNADNRAIYKKMIADYRAKIAKNEAYLASVEVR